MHFSVSDLHKSSECSKLQLSFKICQVDAKKENQQIPKPIQKGGFIFQPWSSIAGTFLACTSIESFVMHMMCVCVCACVHSVMSDSLQTHGLQPARLLCPWDFPGKNTGVGCHFLLYGVFPTQELNLCCLQLLHWQADPVPLCHLGSPKAYELQGISASCDCGCVAGPLHLSTLPPVGQECSHKCERISPLPHPNPHTSNGVSYSQKAFLLDVILVSCSCSSSEVTLPIHIHTHILQFLNLRGIYSQVLGQRHSGTQMTLSAGGHSPWTQATP